MTAVNRWK